MGADGHTRQRSLFACYLLERIQFAQSQNQKIRKCPRPPPQSTLPSATALLLSVTLVYELSDMSGNPATTTRLLRTPARLRFAAHSHLFRVLFRGPKPQPRANLEAEPFAPQKAHKVKIVKVFLAGTVICAAMQVPA